MTKKKRFRIMVNGIELAGSIFLMIILFYIQFQEIYVTIILIILNSIFMFEIVYTIHILRHYYLFSLSENIIQLPKQRLSQKKMSIDLDELSFVIKIDGLLSFNEKNKNTINFDLDDLDNPPMVLKILKKLLKKNRIPFYYES